MPHNCAIILSLESTNAFQQWEKTMTYSMKQNMKALSVLGAIFITVAINIAPLAANTHLEPVKKQESSIKVMKKGIELFVATNAK